MAELLVDDDRLTLALTALERAEGFHRSIEAPAASVTAVRAVTDVWAELRGVRAPGTGIPGVIMVGTRRGSFGKDFAAVHGRGPGVVVELSDHEFERLVLTVPDPDAVVKTVTGALGTG